VIDLRSDTVTRPTPAMRRAMAEAEVGDDVYAEDPTVHQLEKETAALLEQEAALFVPSGTMANQLAMGVLAGPGTEVVLEAGSHIMNYERGAAPALWGVGLRTVVAERGCPTPEMIRDQLRPEDDHVAPVVAVALENTHNRAGGAVWNPEAFDAVCRSAREAGLAVHLDGARLWNASAATGLPVSRLARGVDTVSVCFSKGLGAPVGSAIASTRERITRARRLRKRLGGGMRQAGIIAAGARYALEHHRERLVEDHRRATRLGTFLTGRGHRVLPVETNIVILDLVGTPWTGPELVAALGEKGLLAGAVSAERVRFVTHLEVDDGALETAERTLGAVLDPGR
jgi:threonine aldolase